MRFPFPGMGPYLEHPVLWEAVHARLIIAIANQLQPQLDPRYIASVEERVFVERPQRRVPEVWVQKVEETPRESARTKKNSKRSWPAIVIWWRSTCTAPGIMC